MRAGIHMRSGVLMKGMAIAVHHASRSTCWLMVAMMALLAARSVSDRSAGAAELQREFLLTGSAEVSGSEPVHSSQKSQAAGSEFADGASNTFVSPAARQARTHRGVVSFEPPLDSESGMTTRDVEWLITSQDLPRLIDRFAVESDADPDARMLSRTLGPIVGDSVAGAGGRMRLTGFTCGVQVCIGIIQHGNLFEYLAWRDSFAMTTALSGAEVRAVTMPERDGSLMMRFLFFVDPAWEPRSSPENST